MDPEKDQSEVVQPEQTEEAVQAQPVEEESVEPIPDTVEERGVETLLSASSRKKTLQILRDGMEEFLKPKMSERKDYSRLANLMHHAIMHVPGKKVTRVYTKAYNAVYNLVHIGNRYDTVRSLEFAIVLHGLLLMDYALNKNPKDSKACDRYLPMGLVESSCHGLTGLVLEARGAKVRDSWNNKLRKILDKG